MLLNEKTLASDGDGLRINASGHENRQKRKRDGCGSKSNANRSSAHGYLLLVDSGEHIVTAMITFVWRIEHDIRKTPALDMDTDFELFSRSFNLMSLFARKLRQFIDACF